MTFFFQSKSDQFGSYKKLIFTPNNDIFKTLVQTVSERLHIEDAIGVSDAYEMENIVNGQKFAAGIEFHHPHVSMNHSFP